MLILSKNNNKPACTATPAKRCFARVPLILIAALLLIGGRVAAQELRVGLATITSSPDPHFYDIGPNSAARQHIYEALFRRTADLRFEPLLAESAAPENDTTWVIKLRRDVRFTDGSALTAADVIATLTRLPLIKGSPSSYAPYITFVSSVAARDEHTVVVTTKGPYPNLPQYFAAIGIIPKSVAERGNDVRFDDPANAIGTGPYRFAEFVPSDRFVITRNEAYRGGREPWSRVTFRQFPSTPTRTAALLAGDLDIIDQANVADIARLQDAPNTTIAKGPSIFVLFLQPFQGPDAIPGVRGKGTENPLADRRVREALSLAIDREAIVARVIEGLGAPASQLVVPGFFGFNDKIPTVRPDLVRARALLAEAGYEQGFELLLSSPKGRYMNDDRVAQAVAQMLTRVGIKATVEAMPVSTLFARRNKSELALFLGGFGTNTGESLFALQAMVGTRNEATGMGRINFSKYGNPAIDALISSAATDMGTETRGASLREAMRLAVAQDFATIPLHQEFNIWGLRKGIRFEPRMDADTLAMSARPAQP